MEISDRDLQVLVMDLMSFSHLYALTKANDPALRTMAEERMRDISANLAHYRDVTLGELMETMEGKDDKGRKRL